MAETNATRFAIVPEAVLRTMRGDEMAQAVYAAIALHADEAGVAWPEQATVAEILGRNEGTVRVAIGRLKRADLIEISPRMVGGRKVGNLYRLTPERGHARVPTERARPRAPERGHARVPRVREPLLREGNTTIMNKEITPPTPSEAPTLGVVLPMPTGRLLDVPTTMDRVFDAWRIATHRTSTRVILTDRRKRLIRARLKEGYEIDDLVDAVRGIMRSPFHCGKNDTGGVYTDLTHALKDGEHVERFRDLERGAGRATERPTGESPSEQVARVSRMINGDQR